MEQLTATQAKQVIEYFGAQAAEDAPVVVFGGNESQYDTFNKHLWLTRHAVCIAIEREVTAHDWYAAVVNMIDAQSFDRDPAGYLNERGYTDKDRDYMQGVLEDLVSWSIDMCYNNAKADW